MTRYSHGLFLIATLAICYLIFLTKSFNRRFWQIVIAWLPDAIFCFTWLIPLGHWQWLRAYADVQSQQSSFVLMNGYLFYPRQILAESSGWLPILLIAIAEVFWIKRRQITQASIPYPVFFFLSLVVLSTRTHNIAQFGMILFPPFWILATDGVAEPLALLKNSKLQIVVSGAFLLADTMYDQPAEM